jgi:UDP-glucose 4-epimerase
VLDNLSSGRKSNLSTSAELFVGDIASEQSAQWIEHIKPDCVLHLAAQMDVRRSVSDPVFDAHTNVVGTVRVLNAAIKAKCQTVIFASTGGAIYGEQNYFPADEMHPTQPESPYGVSKLCCEHYLDYFGKAYGMRTASMRFANVYGPKQDPHGEAGVVAIFAQKLLAEVSPTIYGDGEQTRDFVYVGDVVRALLMVLERKDAHGRFNVGTGVETSVNELARIMARIAHFTDDFTYREARAGEQRRSVISAQRLRDTVGWHPQMSLEEGLNKTLQWFK